MRTFEEFRSCWCLATHPLNNTEDFPAGVSLNNSAELSYDLLWIQNSYQALVIDLNANLKA
jgi:hypothetical protein